LRSTANTGNVALRVPDAAIPRAVVERFGLPITPHPPTCRAPRSVPTRLRPRPDRRPHSAHHRRRSTGHAQPTTIVDLSLGPGRWEILREGAIPTHEIVMVLQR